VTTGLVRGWSSSPLGSLGGAPFLGESESKTRSQLRSKEEHHDPHDHHHQDRPPRRPARRLRHPRRRDARSGLGLRLGPGQVRLPAEPDDPAVELAARHHLQRRSHCRPRLHDGAERSLRSSQRRRARPETGTIRRIRVIAGGPGSFRPQVATVRQTTSTLLGDTKAKVTYTGPKLSYTGQTEANYENDSYKVESFAVSIPVRKGQQLALRGNISSMIRCSSGGHNTLIFSPALGAGGPLQGATDANGCWILMEAVIR
jgi:hypothetical protein